MECSTCCEGLDFLAVVRLLCGTRRVGRRDAARSAWKRASVSRAESKEARKEGRKEGAARVPVPKETSHLQGCWWEMPGDRDDEICQRALELLSDLCSRGEVQNDHCQDFIYYFRDLARPRYSDSGEPPLASAGTLHSTAARVCERARVRVRERV